MTETRAPIYPRFLGVDSKGDLVWELPTGRWTWGDDPYQAVTRQRTFTSDRYLDKYGPVEPLVTIESYFGQAPVFKVGDRVVPMIGPAPTEPEPGLISASALAAATAEAFEDGKRRGAEAVHVDRTSVTAEADKLAGAVNALAAMKRAAKDWAEEEARRDRKPSDEQPFVLADILNMIDDAAREVGLTEFPLPRVAQEDKNR